MSQTCLVIFCWLIWLINSQIRFLTFALGRMLILFKINKISRVNSSQNWHYRCEYGHTIDNSDWSINKGFWVGKFFPSGGHPTTRNSESQDQFHHREKTKTPIWKFLNFWQFWLWGRTLWANANREDKNGEKRLNGMENLVKRMPK